MDNVDTKSSMPPGYHDTGEHAYKERTLETYKSMVFRDATGNWLRQKPDNMTPDNPMQWSLRHFHRIDQYLPSTDTLVTDPNIQYDWDWKSSDIFGGYDNFFTDNSQVLDLGSGHGQVVQEINQKYSTNGIKCVGVDYRYMHDKPENTSNLVAGDFKNLPFADQSFDRLLSIESFPAWMPKDRDLIGTYFDEITRVSKQGTIWRGTLPTYDDYETPFMSNEQLAKEFTKRGWELVIDHGGNGSFIA